jgi:hypothetical protein
MDAMREVLGNRIISSGMWAAHSPDINLCNFYLHGTVKQNKVYR